MILAIDAGNTRIKWGLSDGSRWLRRGAVPTAEVETLAAQWGALAAPARAIASNVAGEAVRSGLGRACAERGIALAVIASERERLGVVNGYRDPGQLGTDRWAGLVAAHRSGPGHKLVVNAGTALTIDALAADGRFRGGLIVPGPALMRRSLDRGTAGLRLTEGRFEPFPASTPDAITTGAVQACIGAVERMRAAMAAAGLDPARLVVSGGAAAELAPHLPPGAAMDENLVLEGLLAIARDS